VLSWNIEDSKLSDDDVNIPRHSSAELTS